MRCSILFLTDSAPEKSSLWIQRDSQARRRSIISWIYSQFRFYLFQYFDRFPARIDDSFRGLFFVDIPQMPLLYQLCAHVHQRGIIYHKGQMQEKGNEKWGKELLQLKTIDLPSPPIKIFINFQIFHHTSTPLTFPFYPISRPPLPHSHPPPHLCNTDITMFKFQSPPNPLQQIAQPKMNLVSKGNIFSQIRQYFSKNPQTAIPQPGQERQPAKLQSEESSIRFGREQDEYTKKVHAIVSQRRQTLNPMMALSYASHPLKLLYAKGQYLYEQNGNKVLDCINNVSHIGHCHPYYVMRLNSQNTRLLTNSRFLYDELMTATQKILKKLPKDLCVVTFVNSGSEANDLAMQMAEIHTGRSGVICFDGAYHGITRRCTEVSPYKWSPHYKKSDTVKVAPSPCFYRGPFKDSPDPVTAYKQHLKNMLDDNDGAFISEYMLSCGGQVIPPQNFYQEIYSLLREKNIVCIGDQVQTGFGRLGDSFWAFQHYKVVPNILTIGKAMGNGFPVAAVVCTKEIAESFGRRDMEFFSTFGGNPMAMTAVSAVLDVIQWQKLQENAKETGDYLNKRLKQEILPFYDFVGDIRGVGLFQGIDIVKSKQSRLQDGDTAKEVITKMRERLILVSRDGPLHNVLKIKPPIVFNKQNVDTLIENLKQVLDEIKNEREADAKGSE